MGDGNFRPPTESTPLDRSPKNLVQVIKLPLRLCQIWCKSFDGGLLGKWVKYNEFFYLYFFSWTHLQVRPVNGFSRWMAQTTRTRAWMCLLGVLLTLLPILGVKSPENHNFGGVNRRFQSQTGKMLKVSCYRNYCIDFNQIVHNERDHQEVVVDGPNRRPTNPRWRTADILKKKPLNRHISANVWPILMKFGTMTHIGPLQRIDR